MAITEKYASSAGAGAKNGTSEANAWDWATMLTTAAAGDRINFKGDHTLAASATFSNAGTVTSPIVLRGYSASIGDGYQGRANSNGALVTTNMPTISGGSSYVVNMPNFSIFESIQFTSSRNALTLATSSYSAVCRCLVTNSQTLTNANALSVGTGGVAWDCDIKLTGASGGAYASQASGGFIVSCRIDGGPAYGVDVTYGGVVVGCTIYSSATDAIKINATASTCLIFLNTIVSSGSDGVHQITGPLRLGAIISNLITDNTGYGIYSVDAGAALFSANNRLDRNTAGASSGAADWLTATSYSNNTTSETQANEFENAGSDDYRLKSGSPAKGAGIPQYLDIGALQRQEPAGGGGLAANPIRGYIG